MQTTVAGKKAEYLVSRTDGIVPVQGYRVSGIEWARLFVYGSGADWTVSEIGTGLALTYGKTRKAAVDAAVLKLNEMGEPAWTQKVSALPTVQQQTYTPAPAPVGIIKLGRVKKGQAQDGHYVGRGSALGNPYRMKKETDRIPCILKYRLWLHKQLQDKTSKARAAVSALVKEYKANGSITLL